MENGKALAVREASAVQEAQAVGFSRQQVDLLKRTIAKDATDDELALFMAQAQRMGLDPFVKQIYLVKRGDKATIQVGIDGYRLVADRTGKYAGNDDPEFEYVTGSERPHLARVTVWKIVQGQRCAFTATARWSEYVPSEKQDHMWRKMPHVMLAKVAEALALRKAFPAELSDTYVDAEMDQADDDRPVPAVTQSQPVRPARKPGPPGKLYCSDCREEITGVNVNGQGRISPEEIAQRSHEAHKRQLCFACFGKANKAQPAQQPAPVVVEGEVVEEPVDEF